MTRNWLTGTSERERITAEEQLEPAPPAERQEVLHPGGTSELKDSSRSAMSSVNTGDSLQHTPVLWENSYLHQSSISGRENFMGSLIEKNKLISDMQAVARGGGSGLNQRTPDWNSN